MKEMELDNQARVALSHIFGGHDKGGVQQLADENQMDIAPKEVAILDVQESQLNVVMVQQSKVNKERFLVVSSESHRIGVQVSKETAP